MRLTLDARCDWPVIQIIHVPLIVDVMLVWQKMLSTMKEKV
jgi:hypothetical protein